MAHDPSKESINKSKTDNMSCLEGHAPVLQVTPKRIQKSHALQHKGQASGLLQYCGKKKAMC